MSANLRLPCGRTNYFIPIGYLSTTITTKSFATVGSPKSEVEEGNSPGSSQSSISANAGDWQSSQLKVTVIPAMASTGQVLSKQPGEAFSAAGDSQLS